jgi:hypothetical protein
MNKKKAHSVFAKFLVLSAALSLTGIISASEICTTQLGCWPSTAQGAISCDRIFTEHLWNYAVPFPRDSSSTCMCFHGHQKIATYNSIQLYDSSALLLDSFIPYADGTLHTTVNPTPKERFETTYHNPEMSRKTIVDKENFTFSCQADKGQNIKQSWVCNKHGYCKLVSK